MHPKFTRRKFWDKLAFGSFWATVGTAVLGMMRLPKPSVMPEVSSRLKLGRPEELAPGLRLHFVNRGVILFSDPDGVYAISTRCPHLGCIVAQDAEGRFQCPCHGSRFDSVGRVTAGPAPRGLDWLEVHQEANGQLYADTARPVGRGTKWISG